MRIGALGPEHAGEALTVQRAAYVTEAQRYLAPGIPPLTETLAELRADLQRAGVLPLGAWCGPRLVAAVRGRIDGSRMEVARFVVAPDVQGRGVGSALLAALHEAAPPEVREYWLVTGERSEENLRLYRRVGYVEDSGTRDAAGVALLRMVRPRAGRQAG